MFFFRHTREKLLQILVSRAVIFFLFMSIFTLLLYAAGTAQEFLDSTQLSLLRLYSVLGFFLAASSICGMFLDIGRFFKIRKKRYLLRAGGYLLLLAFAAASVLAAIFIITVSEGNIAP